MYTGNLKDPFLAFSIHAKADNKETLVLSVSTISLNPFQKEATIESVGIERV